MCRLRTYIYDMYKRTRWYNSQRVSFHLSVGSAFNPRGQSKQPLFIVSALQQPRHPRVTHDIIIIIILSHMRTVTDATPATNIPYIIYYIIWSVSFSLRPFSVYTLITSTRAWCLCVCAVWALVSCTWLESRKEKTWKSRI